MKAFGIAFQLWLGTILINSGIVAVVGIFMMNGFAFFVAIIGFFATLFITWPLLFTTSLMIRISCRIPFSSTAKIVWLGCMISLINFIFLWLVSLMGIWYLNQEIMLLFFYGSTVGLIIMLIYSRSALKKLFSQQTTLDNLS